MLSFVTPRCTAGNDTIGQRASRFYGWPFAIGPLVSLHLVLRTHSLFLSPIFEYMSISFQVQKTLGRATKMSGSSTWRCAAHAHESRGALSAAINRPFSRPAVSECAQGANAGVFFSSICVNSVKKRRSRHTLFDRDRRVGPSSNSEHRGM